VITATISYRTFYAQVVVYLYRRPVTDFPKRVYYKVSYKSASASQRNLKCEFVFQ
jgi:hypothetical protein